MDYSERWEIIDKLGEGGQGKVYRVYDKSIRLDVDHEIADYLNSIKVAHIDDLENRLDDFFKNIHKRLSIQDIANHKALKVLHDSDQGRDFESAEERINREIEVMSENRHPNLSKIIDYDVDDKWFVSEYFPGGTLSENLGIFSNDYSKTLSAFRTLVEGVACLHKDGYVHRDIKPANIFLDDNDIPILGDFGLIFFDDDKKTRISATFENVGSRDWMPGWAQGMRVEDVTAKFDVFSLGKVLWSMASGRTVLRLWYFDDPDNGEFNIENIHPNNKFNRLINDLLSKCVVEKEKDCIDNASVLLEEVDRILLAVQNNADPIDTKIQRTCKVCGLGQYELIANHFDPQETKKFGLQPRGRNFKIYTCTHCGHVQMFSNPGDQPAPAWRIK